MSGKLEPSRPPAAQPGAGPEAPAPAPADANTSFQPLYLLVLAALTLDLVFLAWLTRHYR